MGSQTAFGPRGTTTFLQKATAVLAAAFMVTSLSLAIFANRGRTAAAGSVLSGETAAPKSQTATPAQPAQPAPASPVQQSAPAPNTTTTEVPPPAKK
jgi:preprotein translocase subunit SecG